MKLTLKATNDSLRTLLESEGFIFPCGGKGLCGRCKIVAPTLPITEKDKAFISEADLERGIRLACDKVIDGEIEIDCLLEKRATEKLKISEADAYCIFEEGRTLVGLCDGGEILHEVILPSTPVSFRALRATAQKETVELYEEHGLAKATTILLAGTPQKVTEATGIIEEYNYCNTVEARLFDMTSEEVLLLPKPTALVGSDILMEMLGRAEGTFLVKDSYLAYREENHLFIARVIPNINAPEIFVTAVAYFLKRFEPKAKLVVGDNAIAKACGLDTIESNVSQNAASLLASNRPKAKLERLAKKVVELSLADDELFQDLLTDITK